MIPLFTTLAKSITGKIVLGLTVATMGVGAAAAAGAEVPLLTNVDETEETVEETTDDTVEDSADDTGEDTGENTAEETGDGTGEDTGEESDESPVEASAALTDAEPTHGQIVSTFTQETELVGCAKGQATAAVARGDVDPASATLTEDLAPYISKCNDVAHEDEQDEADPAEDETDEGDANAAWKVLRDENKATWHDAKDAFEAACGDQEGDAEGDQDDAADADLSPECEAMKSELKQLHTDGRTEWHDARDAAHAERKAERTERKVETAAAKASERGQSGKGNSGKGNSGRG